MKPNKPTLLLGILVVILLVVVAAVITFMDWNAQPTAAGGVSKINLPALSQQGQPVETLETAKKEDPGALLPPLQAKEKAAAVPTCAIDPLTADEWNQHLADEAARGTGAAVTLQRTANLAPDLAASESQSLPNLLAPGQKQVEAAGQRAYAALWMNVASGRINRATGIDLPDYPEIKTVGDLLDQMQGDFTAQKTAARTTPSALAQASQQVLEGKGIVEPVCARLVVAQAGNLVSDVKWSADGMDAAQVQTETVQTTYKVIGEGTASPDGNRAAFRSGSQDTGGPVFLLDIKTGAWTNLVGTLRSAAADPSTLPDEDSPWDVIGWLPDSRQLVIGPSDLPFVYLVELNSLKYRALPLNTLGFGGSDLVHVSPDGNSLVYIGTGASDMQKLILLDLVSEQSSTILELPYAEGVLQFPRFSPSGDSLSYVVQKGAPDTGLTYTITLYSFEQRASRTLVEGDLGYTRPVWSPDGKHLAFTRKDGEDLVQFASDQAPPPERGNIWVVAVDDGKLWQVTSVNGQAVQPAWANDGKTLSFTTDSGMVGLVDVHNPNQVWAAAETAGEFPLFTTTFFVP